MDTSFHILPNPGHAFLSRPFSSVRSAMHSLRVIVSERSSVTSGDRACSPCRQKAMFACCKELFRPTVIQALREAFPMTKSRDAFFSAHSCKNNADILFGRIGLAGVSTNALYQSICRRFAASGFQFLKSVPKGLTLDA